MLYSICYITSKPEICYVTQLQYSRYLTKKICYQAHPYIPDEGIPESATVAAGSDQLA